MPLRFLISLCFFLYFTTVLPAQDQPIDTTTFDGLIDQSFIVLANEELEEALRLTDKAIALSERIDGKTDKNSLNGHMNRGNVLRTMGRVEEALNEQLSAVTTWALNHDSTSVIFGKMNLYLGNTYFRFSKYPEAINAFKKAMELIPKTDDLYWSAFTEIQTVYGNLGRYHEVLKNYPILIEELEKNLQELKDAPDSPQKEIDIRDATSYFGAVLANQGIVLSNTGNTKDAIPTFKRGLSLIEAAKGKASSTYLDYAPVLVIYYRSIGQADRALAFGKTLWDTAIAANAKPGLTAYIGEVISSVYNQQSQFPEALDYALMADSLYLAGQKGNSFERSSLLLNIGKICNETGQYEKGLEALAKSAEIISSLSGKQHRIYQLGLIQIAEIKGKQGDLEGQITLLEEAKTGLGLNSKTSVRYYPVVLVAKALAHEQLGEIDEAAAEYADLYTLFEDQMTKQFDFFGEAEQIAWQKRLVSYQYKAQNFALRHTDHPAMAGTAFDLHALFQGLAFGNRKRLLERVRNAPDQGIQQLYEEWVGTRKIISSQYRKSSANQSPLLDSIEQRGLVLEQQLARQSQSFKQARKTVSWPDIGKQLPEGEAVIEFAYVHNYKDGNQALGWTIAAFVLRAGQQAPVMINLLTSQDLVGITSTKKLYGTQPAPGKKNLRQLIYEPLSTHLKGIKRIHFSPAGFLHRVNFGAIPINATETINDRFALHQISHAGDLLSAPEKDKKDSQQTALLFGGIDYEDAPKMDRQKADATLAVADISRSPSPDSTALRAYKDGNWDQLSWTANEVVNIEQRLLRNKYTTTLLTGANATEEAFKQMGKEGASPRILHLATHGYFFPKADALKKKDAAKTGFESASQPLVRSGLILAGANHAWRGESIPAGQEDGILTAYEIAEMDLSNTELVVLSACETGLGDIDGSEGVFGLQRAFKMAGAKYVLMSLWNVKDQKTYEFMTMFYELWQGGKSIPEAYQETQSNMRTKYALPFAPRNWAGFVLLH